MSAGLLGDAGTGDFGTACTATMLRKSRSFTRHVPKVTQSLVGFGKRGLLEKGSFQKRPFSRDSREFRDSRDFRESPDCGKKGRIRPFSRDSREFRDFRDSRDSSSEKTPFVMTPFSGPDLGTKKHGNGNVQAKVRANNSGQFEGTAHKNVGFRGKKGQKVHPNFAPNITILFSLPCFFLP